MSPWYPSAASAPASTSNGGGLSTGTGALLVLGAIGLLVLLAGEKMKKERL
jgi:hypothetical protein